MVARYGVSSTAVRDVTGVHKGYRREDLWPVFDRYLAPEGAAP
jgi:hypothetical protein